MFGDVGHGTMMLMFVLLLIYHEDKFMDGGLNEMVQTLFDGRYIIVLMSISCDLQWVYLQRVFFRFR